MKVITMESSAYKEMMAQIANIAGYIREARDEKKRKRETEDKLLDTAQAAKMLNVSKRTMQRMRTDHRIEYVVVRGSCRYRLSEILRLLEDNTVRNEEGTIDTLFHNHHPRGAPVARGKTEEIRLLGVPIAGELHLIPWRCGLDGTAASARRRDPRLRKFRGPDIRLVSRRGPAVRGKRTAYRGNQKRGKGVSAWQKLS